MSDVLPAVDVAGGKWERTEGTIEETVTGLDGVVDGIGSDVLADLPEAEAVDMSERFVVEC